MNITEQELVLLIEAREAVATGRGARLRETARLSQGELSQAIGVSAGALSRWESGSRLPSGDEALRYARMLRVLAKATNGNKQ